MFENMQKNMDNFYNENISDEKRIKCFNYIKLNFPFNTHFFETNFSELISKNVKFLKRNEGLKNEVLEMIKKSKKSLSLIIWLNEVDKIEEFDCLFGKGEYENILQSLKDNAATDLELAKDLIRYNRSIKLSELEKEKLISKVLVDMEYFLFFIKDKNIDNYDINIDYIKNFIFENKSNNSIYRYTICKNDINPEIFAFILKNMDESIKDEFKNHFIKNIVEKNSSNFLPNLDCKQIIYNIYKDDFNKEIGNSFILYHNYFINLFEVLNDEEKNEYYRKLKLYSKRAVNNINSYLWDLERLEKRVDCEDLKININSIRMILKFKDLT